MAENANNTQTDTNGNLQQGNDRALPMPVDVIEDASGITLLADMPGVTKDKLNLQLEKDSLTIEGEVTLESPQEMQSVHAEISVPRYRKKFSLSKELDGEQATAEYKNGVLKLHIPKAQHTQPRKIQINVT